MEFYTDGHKNTTYIKKTFTGIPFASPQWWKRSANTMLSEQYGVKMTKAFNLDGNSDMDSINQEEKQESQHIITEGDPFNNYDEDLFGFMNTCSVPISEQEYLQLPEDIKIIYSKHSKQTTVVVNEYVTKSKKDEKKVITETEYNELNDEEKELFKLKQTKVKQDRYTKKITKKRRAVVQTSSLMASKRCVKNEFCVNSKAAGNNAIFTKETFSSVMSQTFNVDLNRLGRFKIGAEKNGYIDYIPNELKEYDISFTDGDFLELPQDVKNERLKYFLTSVEKFNTTIRQTNNLEDLRPKFVILTEISVGNNPFMFVYKDGKLNIEMLKDELEALYDDEELVSDVFIGITSGFMSNDEENKLTEMISNLEDGLKNKIKISNVHKAFKNYKDTL